MKNNLLQNNTILVDKLLSGSPSNITSIQFRWFCWHYVTLYIFPKQEEGENKKTGRNLDAYCEKYIHITLLRTDKAETKKKVKLYHPSGDAENNNVVHDK